MRTRKRGDIWDLGLGTLNLGLLNYLDIVLGFWYRVFAFWVVWLPLYIRMSLYGSFEMRYTHYIKLFLVIFAL